MAASGRRRASDRPTCGPERMAHLLSQIQREPQTACLAADEDPYLGLKGVVSLREMADALEDYQVQRAARPASPGPRSPRRWA